MMTCPRCGANNDSGRAACWNCYAPLSGPIATRVKPMLLVGGATAGQPASASLEPSDVSDAGAAEPKKKRGLFGKK